VSGFLYNTHDGRTIFKRGAQKINDSMYQVGADTIRTQPNAWIQGGNAFGTTGILGTIDNNHLDLFTNNTRRVRLTNDGKVLVGTINGDGRELQVNGRLSVSDTAVLSGLSIFSNAYQSSIRSDAGKGVVISSNGANVNAGSAFVNNATGSVIISAPLNDYSGLGGTINNSIVIGCNSRAGYTSISNSFIMGRDIGIEQVYNGPLYSRSNIFALDGSNGILRDDNVGGSTYMLHNFKGNIYLGYNDDLGNWIAAQQPSNYIQLGGSNHNYLGLFGGFQLYPPQQSTLAGPSARPGDINNGFDAGSYFRIAGGKGVGNRIGSDLRFAVCPAGVYGASNNPYIDAVTISAATLNVGIGTTAPTAQLHTTGSVRFDGLTNDNTKTRVLVSDANGNLSYRDASTLAANDILRSSLAINGPITAEKLTLSAHNWPDYVFDSAYQLPSLSSLENYIRQQHHLPGIVPAGDAQRNGVDVGATQAELLKKIEELTLYSISQDKRLDEQNKKLESQQNDIGRLQNEINELKKLIRSGHE